MYAGDHLKKTLICLYRGRCIIDDKVKNQPAYLLVLF